MNFLLRGARFLWRWWTEPTDRHTNLGKCVCPVCTTHLWEDK